jgi:5-methyltetrahydropteroyltriglutamate--homocysteine methyltransferase
MKRSTDRILTSHAGSLPRPDDLREMLIARDAGQPLDQQAFGGRVRSAVAQVVRKQVDSGLDIVNDGELSKINFTSYARTRLGGVMEREATPGNPMFKIYGRDEAEFSEYFAGRATFGIREAVCAGPLTYVGPGRGAGRHPKFQVGACGCQG